MVTETEQNVALQEEYLVIHTERLANRVILFSIHQQNFKIIDFKKNRKYRHGVAHISQNVRRQRVKLCDFQVNLIT